MPRKKTKAPSTISKQETVTLTKEQFDKLIEEITKLKEELEIVKAQKEQVELITPQQPRFYSLSPIETLAEAKRREERKLAAEVKEKLEKAIDMIILDGKLNPPKRHLV